MPTLNVVVQTQKILNVQVTKIRQLSQKTQKTKNKKTKTTKKHLLVLADCKLKLRKIAEELKISEGSILNILNEHMSMRKLC